MVGILDIQAASSDKKSRARLQAANGRNITLLVKREKDHVLWTERYLTGLSRDYSV